jgi:NAD(P)-dependent dehydrogenase (short-subunit alcohol dehydrogenase family)
MDLKLKGKKALVTGSTAGIGFAIAQGLAQEGASVVINGRTDSRVQAALQQLRSSSSGELSGITADLGSAEGVQGLTARLAAVDILINNVGIFQPKPFPSISDEEWLRTFNVNVMSGVRLSRAYLPGMKERGWGRVIFISSESALNTPAEMIDYGVSKTAQLALARGLAETMAGTGVTVNSVLPGPTRSEGAEVFITQMAKEQNMDEAAFEKEFFKSVRPGSLIKRFARPEEIAAMVVYLCGEPASATTGAAVRVDGGVVHTIA